MSIRILEWVFQHSAVERRSDLLVLLVLASHAHDDGDGAYPSVPTIARKARLSRRGVQLALRRLEASGAIEVTAQERGRPATYRVVMGGEASSRGGQDARGEGTSQGGARTARRGRTERAGGAKHGAPEPSIEPSGKNRQKGGERGSPPGPVYPINSNNGAKAAFASEHFPDVEPGYVSDAAWKLKRRRRVQPTAGRIREIIREEGRVS